MGLKKHIPNTITLMNLLCGSIAVIFALKGWQIFAVYLILTAALMDFLDGFSARMLKAYSEVGKELDSLADLVSFGLAPSLLLYSRFNSHLSGTHITPALELLSFTPLLITLASALRLAIFNLDTRQTVTFIGMPTPANALLISMLIHFTVYDNSMDTILNTMWFIPLSSIVLSYLLISNIPMFSLKIKGFSYSENKKIYLFLLLSAIIIIPILISGKVWSMAVFALFVVYILFNSLTFLYEIITKRSHNSR
ncbi:MAG: CDP-diacylglycerol--serine O-phosphatidyltransferase [Bacteroidales bacterium]